VLVVVLADTHLRDSVREKLPRRVLEAMSTADLVLHAGDVVSANALGELESLAQVVAVLGNNDHELAGRLPLSVELDLEGVRVAMVHDSGDRRGREARLAQRFPRADLVVFGHSHVPLDAEGGGGQRLFNPGSPTQRRAQPQPSFGLLEVHDGSITASIELL
jgi:putative phosphoesterase